MAEEVDLLGILAKKKEKRNALAASPMSQPTGEVIPLQPKVVPSPPDPVVFGPTMKKAEELFPTVHPATQKVLSNIDLTQDMNPTDEAKFKTISEVSNIPIDLARSMHPAMVNNFMERQDTKFYLDQALETRKRMAIDAEAALVLRGEIPYLAASEQSLARLGVEIRPPYKDYVQQKDISIEEQSIMAGIGSKLADSIIRFGQVIPLEFKRENLIERAADANRTAGEVVGDWYERSTRSQKRYVPEIGEIYGLSKRLINWVTGVPEDAEKHRQEALEISRKLIPLYKSMQGGGSTYAQGFWDRVGAIDPDASELTKAQLLLETLIDMPGEATNAMVEVVAQQAVPLAAGAATTLLTKNPSLGVAVATAGGYAQERFNEYNKDLVKKFGKEASLETEAGMRAFLDDPKRQDFVKGIGEDRALIISIASLLGFKIAGARLAKGTMANVALQIPTQGFVEMLGEGGGQIYSGQGFDSIETILEGLGGGVTAPIDIIIAADTNRKERTAAKEAQAWLKSGGEISTSIKGIAPEALATASEVMAEKLKQEGVTTVYLSAAELVKFDQDLPSGETATETLGLDTEAIQEAAANGQDVEIGAEAYVRHILGKDGFEALINHTRMTMEGMTPQEAADFTASGAEGEIDAQLIQERMERQLGVTEEEGVALREDAEAITSDVRDQMSALGKDGREADLNALLTARRYVARAARATKAAGEPVSALELYMRDNVLITDETVEVQATAALAQSRAVAEAETELSKGFKDPPIPELEEAARRREAREITQAEYNKIVSRLKPVTEYRAEDLLEPATSQEMADALTENKRSRVGKGAEWLGKLVGLRLDIPAYKNNGVWVPTIHDSKGSPQAHEATAHIIGVTFTMPGDTAEKKAGRVGRGEQDKSPFAQMKGTLQSVDAATLYPQIKDLIGDPEWTQVGYDPRRHTFFYDRKTQKAVLSADEVIQVGPLVMARNVKFATRKEVFLFQPGVATSSVSAADAVFEGAVTEAKATLKKAKAKVVGQKNTLRKLKTGEVFKGKKLIRTDPLGTPEQITAAEKKLTDLEAVIPTAEEFVTEKETEALPSRQARADARAARDVFNPIPGVDTSVGGGLTERSHIHIADLEGAYVIPIFADLTATGVTFDSLDGIPIAPTSYFGGPNFSWLQQYREDGIVWAFNSEGVVTGLKNHVTNLRARMAEEGLAPRVVITVQAMSQQAHLSNSMVSGALLKTLDGMVTAKVINKKAAKAGHEIILSKANNAEEGASELATFPPLSNPAAVHKWLTKGSTFNGRKALSRAIATAEFSNIEGMFPVGRVIREAIDQDFRATQTGDTVLAFEIDPSDPDLLVNFTNPLENVRNVDVHPSYKVGMRGKLLGTMATTIPQKIMYKDAVAHRRSLGAKGEDKFLLERLPNGQTEGKPVEGQYVGPELVKEAQLVEDIGDYRVAQAYSSIFAGEWSRSDVSVTEGGVSPAEAERAIEESAGRPLLSALSRKQVEQGAKDGSLIIHQLGSERVGSAGEGGMNSFLGVASGYDYASEYEGDASVAAAYESGELTENEVALVSVVNNETAVKGLGTWMVLKGIQEGVTVLDAFDVKSDADSSGKLPKIYGTLGFQEVARIPFDAKYLTPAHVAAWEADGWTPTLGLPDIVVMKWRGSEDARTDATRNFVLKGQSGLGLGSIQGVTEHASEAGRIPELDEDGRGSDGVDGESYGQDDPRQFEDRARSVSNRGRHFIEGVLRADDVATGALKLPKERLSKIEAAYAALPTQQTTQGGVRGQFTPSSQITDQNGDPMNLIQIFEAGDRSTFLHESGHFWLEQLKSDAAEFGAEFEKDWGTVRKWWSSNTDAIRGEALDRARRAGDKEAVAFLSNISDTAIRTHINSGDLTGEGSTRYLSVAMHEQFARGTENYFKTGNAPSLALSDAFIAFAAWVRSVYNTLNRLAGRDNMDVQFSPEVTEVMDKMLASDAEIEVVSSQYQLISLFSTAEEAGMSKKEFADHNENIAKQKEAAKITQLSKRVREMERERLTWWKEEREEMRDSARYDIARTPAFRLLWATAQGGLADGSTATVSEKVNRMDREQLKVFTERDDMPSLYELPKAGGKAIYEAATKGNAGSTMSPGMTAQIFQYDTVEEMLSDLAAQPDYDTAVETEMDRRMKEKHGSIDDGAIDAAVASIHEQDGIAKTLAAELAALRTTETAIKPKFVKAYAAKKISEAKVGEANPRSYLAAEKRSAKAAGKALKKGDRAEAYKHQFQRLVNHYMAAEAQKVKSQLAKKLSYMRQFKRDRKKWPSVDADYIDAIRAKVSVHDFSARVSDKRRTATEQDAFAAFLEKAKEDDGAIFDVPEWLRKKDRLVHFRDLSVGEFNELHDAIKQLEKQGRNAKKLMLGQESLDRDVVVARMLTSLSKKPTATAVRKRGEHIAKSTTASLVAGLDAALLKVEFLLEMIDGEPLGAWHQAIYQPFAEAETLKQDLSSQVSNLIYGKISALPKAVRQGMGKRVDVGALAGTKANPDERWDRGNLIVLALNVGNDSNLSKVIRGEEKVGREINEELIDAALAQLTKEEWDFIQSLWDHADVLWPSVEKIYRKENGRVPDRVEPREVATPHGVYRGGYFPLMYDSNRSAAGKQIESMDALEAFQSENVRASVNSSMVKERIEGFSAPINFDVQKIATSFDKTIHFISHYDAVRNANRILGHPELKDMMSIKLGPKYVASLNEWVGSIASNGYDRPPVDDLEAVVGWVSRNTTTAVLGLSYTTLTAQILGYTTALDILMKDGTYIKDLPGVTKDLAMGMGQALSKEHRAAVRELSGEMRHRLNNTDRDLRAGLRVVQGQSGVQARVAEFAMLTIAAMQLYIVDFPVWTAAYNRALREEQGDVDTAVAYADRVVRQSQSGGGLKDLATVQRNKGYGKLLTMFYSFFSVVYAILRSIGHEVVLKNPTSIPRMLARIAVTITLGEIGYGLMKGEVPDLEPDDEDKDGAVKWAAKKTLSGIAGSVPFGRDLVQGALGDYGYSMSPTAMFGEAVAESYITVADKLDYYFNDETKEEPPELKDIKPLVLTMSILFKFPGIQANRTLSGLFALMEGEEDADFFDLATGYKKKKE